MKRSPLDLLRQAFSRLGGSEGEPLEGARGVGQRGEIAAVAALRRRGYEVIERNFRTPAGEIDVIAEEGGVLCFIEVKWRRTAELGHPAEAVTPEKRRRLARAAEWYLAREDRRGSICRFDVVAILAVDDDDPLVEIYPDAFRGPFPPRRRR
jgi:putative endonuclease